MLILDTKDRTSSGGTWWDNPEGWSPISFESWDHSDETVTTLTSMGRGIWYMIGRSALLSLCEYVLSERNSMQLEVDWWLSASHTGHSDNHALNCVLYALILYTILCYTIRYLQGGGKESKVKCAARNLAVKAACLDMGNHLPLPTLHIQKETCR